MYNTKIIRFRRRGGRFCYRFDIVVIYKNKRSKGDFVEKLGFFNPYSAYRTFLINLYKLGFWINKGALIHPKVKRYLYKSIVK